MKQTAKRTAVAVGAMSAGALLIPGASAHAADNPMGASENPEQGSDDRLAQYQNEIPDNPFNAAGHEGDLPQGDLTAPLRAAGGQIVNSLGASVNQVRSVGDEISSDSDSSSTVRDALQGDSGDGVLGGGIFNRSDHGEDSSNDLDAVLQEDDTGDDSNSEAPAAADEVPDAEDQQTSSGLADRLRSVIVRLANAGG